MVFNGSPEEVSVRGEGNYEMALSGPGTIGKAQYVNAWGEGDDMGVLLEGRSVLVQKRGSGDKSPDSLQYLCVTKAATTKHLNRNRTQGDGSFGR